MNGRSSLTDKTRVRAAFVTCLAATLIVVGALVRVLTGPFAVDPQLPNVAIMDGFLVTEHVIVPVKSTPRVLPDTHRPGPAVDRSPTTLLPAAMANWVRAAVDDTASRLDFEVFADTGMRPAHRPRAPPSRDGNVDQPGHSARLLTLTSWNCGANLPKGFHRA